MSVFSQVKSGRLRPKWPPKAVWAKIGRRRFRCSIMPLGVSGNRSQTISLILVSLILAVPWVLTSTEIGWATPMA